MRQVKSRVDGSKADLNTTAAEVRGPQLPFIARKE